VVAFNGGTGEGGNLNLRLTDLEVVDGSTGPLTDVGMIAAGIDATAIINVRNVFMQGSHSAGITIAHEEGNAQVLIEDSEIRNIGRNAISITGTGTNAAASTMDIIIRNNIIQEYANAKPPSARAGI
jgi:hypothetical protein